MTDNSPTLNDDIEKKKFYNFTITEPKIVIDKETDEEKEIQNRIFNVEASRIGTSELFNLLINTDQSSVNISTIYESFDNTNSSIYKNLNNYNYNFENLKTLILCPYPNSINRMMGNEQLYPLWLSGKNTGKKSSGLIYIDMNNSIGLKIQTNNNSYFGVNADNEITDIILIYNEILDQFINDDKKTRRINIYSNAFNKYSKLKNVYIYGIPNFYNVNNNNDYYLFHEDVRSRDIKNCNKINFYFIKPNDIKDGEYHEKIDTFLNIDVNLDSDNITNGCLLKPDYDDFIEDEYKKEKNYINVVTPFDNESGKFNNDLNSNNLKQLKKCLKNKCQISINSKFNEYLEQLTDIETIYDVSEDDENDDDECNNDGSGSDGNGGESLFEKLRKIFRVSVE